MYFNELDKERSKTNQANGDRIVALKQRIEQLIRVSKDPAFTRYLQQLLQGVVNEENRITHLSRDLDKQYQVYLKNMQARGVIVQPAQVTQPTPQITQPVAAQPVAAQPVAEQSVAQPVAAQPTSEQSVVQPVATPQMKPQATVAPVKRSRNTEFTIGAAVLSIVGSAFVLTAMVLLGMYFMDGFLKGMILYVACAAVIALSELLLYRRWPGLGMTFSAIGLAGLYISTMVNYLALGNFNEWVTVGVTAVITALIIFMSRKRDAALYRVLGMTAMYLCYVLILCGKERVAYFSQAQILTVTIMCLLVNVMCLSVPIQKGHTAVNIIHMALNALFTSGVVYTWVVNDMLGQDTLVSGWQYPMFIVIAILIMQLIYVVQIRWKEKQEAGGGLTKHLGIVITYCCSALMLAVLCSSMAGKQLITIEDATTATIYRVVCSLIVVVLGMIPIVMLRDRREKWFSWYFVSLSAFLIHLNSDELWEVVICLLVILLTNKALSFKKDVILAVSDAVITSFCSLFVLVGYEKYTLIPLFIGLLVSVVCVNYWETFFETTLTFTIALYVSLQMVPILKLPVFVGILFAAMLLFNNVKRWHGKYIVIFNILALAGQAGAYLWLMNPVYQNAYLTYLCMVIFGVATIVICLNKTYHLEFNGKELVLAVFLTYMALVIKTNFPIVNSILLMIIALVCVGLGFYNRKKSVRIYGLSLSLLVCAKLVLYDFMGAHMIQKTVVFFVVGVIALAIASIYMILERKQEQIFEKKEQQ